MRRCKIPPTSCRRPDKPCCADCPDKTCAARCENKPELCGCWTEAEPCGTPKRFSWNEMARLRGLGLTQKEIAWRLGCAPQTVSVALRKLAQRGDGHGQTD